MPASADPKPEQPEFVGVVTSSKTQVISVPFNGRVKRVAVHAGQRVHKDDAVATLDDTDLRSEIAGYLAEEKAARMEAGSYGATASAARAKLAAVQRLRRIGVAAGMEVTSARADLGTAGSQSAAAASRGLVAKSKREVAERKLEHATITAPFDGVVMMIKAKEGGIAQQGEAIARIFDPSDLRIKFGVPREFREQLKLNGRVELHVDGVSRTLWAKIDQITNEEAPLTLSVVEADLDDSKLGPDEVQLASRARVRLADIGHDPKKTAAAGANR